MDNKKMKYSPSLLWQLICSHLDQTLPPGAFCTYLTLNFNTHLNSKHTFNQQQSICNEENDTVSAQRYCQRRRVGLWWLSCLVM